MRLVVAAAERLRDGVADGRLLRHHDDLHHFRAGFLPRPRACFIQSCDGAVEMRREKYRRGRFRFTLRAI